MNEWLANIYGTGGAEDIEKTAQHHLIQKLAAEQGIDLSGLNEDEVNQLAAEVLGGEETETQEEAVEAAPAEDPAIALQKEAQAKFEEADFLGRVMAHSYTQELEKIAAAKTAGKLSNFGSAVASKAKHFGKAVDKKVQHVGQRAVEVGTRAGKGSGAHLSPSTKRKAGYGLAGGVAAAGAAAHHKMKKEASAFEKLAEMHAAEILGAAQQAGYDPAAQGQQLDAQGQVQGQEQVQEQQTAQPEQAQQFQQALDERALQLLQENGYDVEAIVAALNQEPAQA